MKPPLVSIIIVNYNGFNVLKPCLESVYKLTYESFEVIVVDNGSTDESITYLDQINKPNFLLVKSKKNLGFAGGNNLGVKKAQGKYYLLLNNDTTVEKNLLSVLVDKMEEDISIGALQPKIKVMDNPKILDNAGAYLNRLGLSVHWGYGEKDSPAFDNETEIFSAKGACLLTRSEIVNEIGLFDDSFGSYFEESDFCWRVWLIGKRVIYYPRTFILHKIGFTSSKMDTVNVMLHSTKNRVASLFKNLSSFNLISIFIPHILFLIALGTYYLLRFQFRKSWMIFGALWWNITHSLELIKKRRFVQRKRVVSDHDLFKTILRPIDLAALFVHFKSVEANLNKI